MELAIRVMVVLLVALAVGASVIFFARGVIGDAKTRVNEIEFEDQPEKVVDKGTALINAKELVYLAEECYKMGRAEANLEELCFIVHGGSSSVSVAQMEAEGMVDIPNYNSANMENINGKTVVIYYIHTENTVKITQ